MSKNERRALFYSSNLDHDPYIQLDINEYLIETWPQLNLKQRKCVWTLCQNDEEFDFSDIEAQVDSWVYEFADSVSDLDLPEPEEEEEEDETDGPSIDFPVYDYLSERFPSLTDNQLSTLSDYIVDDDDVYSSFADIIDSKACNYASTTDTSLDLTNPELDDQ